MGKYISLQIETLPQLRQDLRKNAGNKHQLRSTHIIKIQKRIHLTCCVASTPPPPRATKHVHSNLRHT
jgi:hypothetical protein